MVEQEESNLIKATEDSHEDEEHIPPPQDEEEDEGDTGDDTEEGQIRGKEGWRNSRQMIQKGECLVS